jgi:putative ABC transport system ATP-binding protein
MGASGSGKSTMLNMIGVLDSPSEGSIIVDGTDVTHLDESAVARIRGKKIGFVFQAFNLSPTLSVYENIALPMRIHEFPDKEIAQKVEGLIRLVGLSHRVSHLPGQLSGGERQRVAIARALSTDPALLLADEPTGNLDTKTSMEIIRLFEDLNAKEGKTVVLVTHEPDIAAHCRRIVTMRDGLIVSDEPNAKRRVVS